MRIGIISKPEHCKAHAAGLTSDGHSVVVIGGGKNPSVPDAVEVLILRTASCSHGASDVAFAWARERKRPLIVDNGLSGMRRELKRLRTSVYKDALDLLVESRPGDSLEKREAALRAMGATDDILNALLTPDPAMDRLPDLTPNTPYPISESWTNQYPLRNIHKGWRDATRITRSIEAAGSGDVGYLTRAYLKVEAFPEDEKVSVKASRLIRRHFKGKPMAFALFVHHNTRGKPKTKAVLNRVYQLCTGKGTDTRVSNAAGWYLDEPAALSSTSAKKLKSRAVAEVAVIGKTPVLVQAGSGSNDPPPAIDSNTLTIDSNTKTILDLLDSVERMEAQIKTLERSDLAVRAASRAHINDEVDALKEELRGDIANAFDALAAEQQTPVSGDLSSNPFAALEQVKAALKAAGFKGTLTLTIE